MWMRNEYKGVGVVLNYKYVHNKAESEFPTGQVKHLQSCERLRSCLSIDGVLDDKVQYMYIV